MTNSQWYGDWLQRLGFDATPPVTLDGLRAIQAAHLLRIPFENLDPLFGTVPSLDLASLSEKILHQRRGGYCFEVNGLLAQALAEAGFDASLHLARVMWRRAVPGPLTHCLLIVTLGTDRYLVDAGFGGPVPPSPISLETRSGCFPDSAGYSLSDGGDLGTILTLRTAAGDSYPLYAFVGAVASPDQLLDGNHIAATSPQSPFTQRLVATRLTPDGRIALDDTRFTRRGLDGADLSSRDLSPGETVQVLADSFNLSLDHGLSERVAQWLAAQNPNPDEPGFEGTVESGDTGA